MASVSDANEPVVTAANWDRVPRVHLRDGQRHPDWLIQVLIDRCIDGSIADTEDLSTILSLNLGIEMPSNDPDEYMKTASIEEELSLLVRDYERRRGHGVTLFGTEFGEAIQELGKVVASKGGVLVVPNLEDYDQTEILRAPGEWLDRWTQDDDIPDRGALWAAFHVYSAKMPNGTPMIVDGPGTPTLEIWREYCKRRDHILNERRMRRLKTRAGQIYQMVPYPSDPDTLLLDALKISFDARARDA